MTDSKKPGVEMRRQVMGVAFVDRALGDAAISPSHCRISSMNMRGAACGTATDYR